MRKHQISSFFALALTSSFTWAEIEFFPAYMNERENSISVSFPNDRQYQFMSKTPLIAKSEIKSAKAIQQDGRAFIDIEITRSARNKLNQLISKNIDAHNRGVFEDHTGLAAVINGKNYSVTQGLFQPITSNGLSWSPIDDRLPTEKQFTEAQSLAKKINSNIASNNKK